MTMAQAIECMGCEIGWKQGCTQWVYSKKPFNESKCPLITAKNVFADKPKDK